MGEGLERVLKAVLDKLVGAGWDHASAIAQFSTDQLIALCLGSAILVAALVYMWGTAMFAQPFNAARLIPPVTVAQAWRSWRGTILVLGSLLALAGTLLATR